MLLSGCTLTGTPRPDTYVVERGDTLYSIAWRYGIDWRELAHWNDIEAPYTIYPGQRLTLDRYGPAPASPSDASAVAESEPPPRSASGEESDDNRASQAKSEPDIEPATEAENAAAATERRWHWPADGEVERRYSGSRHGIDIGGEAGAPVRASGDGRVVYSGSGLKGYGKLVIIKHDERYLSAYGYNQRLLVGQGSEVGAGDQIAEMGMGPGQAPAVHFEIRRDGKPLDPSRILPNR